MSAPSCQAEVKAPQSHVKRSPRQGKHRVAPLTQALDLKDIAYRDGTANETPVHIKAALMRAWVDLQEMAMALRGQGKPKPVEARNATSKRKPHATVSPIARVTPQSSEPASDASSNSQSPGTSAPDARPNPPDPLA